MLMAKDAPRRAPPGDQHEAPLTKAQQRETVGFRIARLRGNRELTQDQLAKKLDVSRSSIAQWERNESTPSLTTLRQLAAVMQTAPEYLAFGVDMEPKVVMPAPETMGFAVAHEVQFGESPDELIETGKWGLPIGWLKTELGVTSYDGLIVFRVEVDSAGFSFGDRVIVDRSQKRASPPGTFLYWDGIGPAIGQIMVIPGGTSGKKGPVAKINGASGSYEVDINSLKIIGRVRGVWKKA
jgi:transcriptional regulator with XRE-family HTH domain